MKANMKDLLAEGLYHLIIHKPFEKITIKQICDKTGVIRGTFYNHFLDKYECLEYLCFSLIISENEKYIKQLDYSNFVEKSLNTIYEHKDFFYKAFQIEGQNKFSDMLHKVYYKELYKILRVKKTECPISLDSLASYHSATLVLMIQDWVNKGCNQPIYKVIEVIRYFYQNNLYDLLNN